MNSTFSVELISTTRNLDANIILLQDQLDFLAQFMEIKSINPKMKQKEMAKI